MKQFAVCMTLALVLSGCSGSTTPDVAVHVAAPASGLAIAAPSVAPAETQPAPVALPGPTEPAEKDTKSSLEPAEGQTVDDIDKLFAKPAPIPVVIENKEPPPPVQPTAPELPKKQTEPPPPTRLLGFSQMDELKALVSINGKMNVLGIGQSAEDVELIALAPPSVTLKYGDTEFEINLNEQEWTQMPPAGARPVGATLPLPKGPPPVQIPGDKRGPAPKSPSSPRDKSGALNQFPAASPPPVPPPPKR